MGDGEMRLADDNSKERVAKRLRQLRESKEYSQTALAEKAGLSRSAVVHYETAKAMPGGNELVKLANALESTPNYILSGSDDFGGTDEDLGILSAKDQNMAMMRLSLLILSLNRKTREHLAALVVDMVRQSHTESEFEQLKQVIDLLETQMSDQLGSGLDALVDSLDYESIESEVQKITGKANDD